MKIKHSVLAGTYWVLFLLLIVTSATIKMIFFGVPYGQGYLPLFSILILPFGYLVYYNFKVYKEYWENDKPLNFHLNWNSKSISIDKPIKIEIPFNEIELTTHEVIAAKNIHRNFYYIIIESEQLEKPIKITSISLSNKDYRKLKEQEFKNLKTEYNKNLFLKPKQKLEPTTPKKTDLTNHLKKRLENLNDIELQNYLEKPDDYTKNAVEAVKQILEERKNKTHHNKL